MTTAYLAHLQRVAARKQRLSEQLGLLFPREQAVKLSWEIGCGHGHWLVDYARRFPDKRCLGIDLIGDRIERAVRKAEAAGVGNVDFLKSEALETLEALPLHLQLTEVFLMFPDPWPKKRHWKNRLLSRDLLERLGRRSELGARLHFRTDHADYFEWAIEEVAGQRDWKVLAEAEWPFERETVFQARADRYQSMVLVKR